MALCEIRFFSPALGKASEMLAVVPDAGEGPFPVLYLLHGLSDDASIWLRRSRIEWYVRERPLIVVMPDGGRGWYSDAAEGFAYETCMLQDVIGQVERLLPAVRDRGGRLIAGLSMGGYGALKLALGHPDRFIAAASMSGALGMAHYPLSDDEWGLEMKRVFGSNPVGGPHDLFALAKHLNPARMPALWIDCGVDDFLIEANRAFHAHLEKLEVAHIYHEFPGDHSWDYWDTHVQQIVGWMFGVMEGGEE